MVAWSCETRAKSKEVQVWLPPFVHPPMPIVDIFMCNGGASRQCEAALGILQQMPSLMVLLLFSLWSGCRGKPSERLCAAVVWGKRREPSDMSAACRPAHALGRSEQQARAHFCTPFPVQLPA